MSVRPCKEVKIQFSAFNPGGNLLQMLLLLRISAPFLTSTQSLLVFKSNAGVSRSLLLVEKLSYGGLSSRHRHSLRFSVYGRDDRVHSLSDAGSNCSDRHSVHEGGIAREEPRKSNEILKKLKRFGLAGILSYGLLNTAYYLTTFLLVWFYFAPAPGKLGYLAAVERFVKVMAMVWAGSQVTKLVRAGGALALAPLVDRGLLWFTERYKFNTREQAFAMIVGLCFGMAAVMFLAVTLISA